MVLTRRPPPGITEGVDDAAARLTTGSGARGPAYLATTHTPRFIGGMVEVAARGEADVAVIRRSVPVVLRQTERLPTAPRTHCHGSALSAVLSPRGRRHRHRAARPGKQSSGRWSRESADVAMTPEFPILLHAYRECLLSPSTA